MAEFTIAEEVQASADAVWKVVADFGGLESLVEGVTSCKLEGSGVGAVRKIEMGGMAIAERLETFDEAGKLLAYSVIEGPMPTENYLATIKVTATGDKTCTLEWGAKFDTPGMDDEQAAGLAKGIEGSYRGMIEAVKKAAA